MAATTSRTELPEFACLIGVVLSSATLLPNRKLSRQLACVRCPSRHPVKGRFPEPECTSNKAAGAPYTPRADRLTSLFAGPPRGLRGGGQSGILECAGRAKRPDESGFRPRGTSDTPDAARTKAVSRFACHRTPKRHEFERTGVLPYSQFSGTWTWSLTVRQPEYRAFPDLRRVAVHLVARH